MCCGSWRGGLAVAALLTFLSSACGFGMSVWFLTPTGRHFLDTALLLNESHTSADNITSSPSHSHHLTYQVVSGWCHVITFTSALTLCTSVLTLESSCSGAHLSLPQTLAALLTHFIYICVHLTAAINLSGYHVKGSKNSGTVSLILLSQLIGQAVIQFMSAMALLMSTDQFRNGCTSIPLPSRASSSESERRGNTQKWLRGREADKCSDSIRYQPIN